MVDTAPMLPTPLHTDMLPMEPTPMPTARGLLMLTPPFSMVPTDIPMPVSMVDTEPMVPMVLPMEPTPIPTTERGLLMLRLTLPFSTAPMDILMLVSMGVFMVDTEPMVPTLTPSDMASKMSPASV